MEHVRTIENISYETRNSVLPKTKACDEFLNDAGNKFIFNGGMIISI